MVSTQYGAILKQLETFFNCALEPDQNNSCLVQLDIGISVQIEMDKYGFLLIGCKIGQLPMSRYRDNLVQQALKSNNATLPSTGTFGFSQKTNHLVLFIRIDPNSLTTHKIQSLLTPFIAKAKKWSDALAKGETPTVDESVSSSKEPSGIFGLIS